MSTTILKENSNHTDYSKSSMQVAKTTIETKGSGMTVRLTIDTEELNHQ